MSLGHVKIGVINLPLNITTGFERFEGYKKALKDHNIPLDERLIKFAGFTIESGYEQTKELLKSEKKPTAIFSLNCQLTLGALRAIKETNLKIPGDISIIGFDDSEFAELLDPPLNTIAQPVHEIGKKAIEILLKIVKGQKQVKRKLIEFKPELVVIKSCKKIS